MLRDSREIHHAPGGEDQRLSRLVPRVWDLGPVLSEDEGTVGYGVARKPFVRGVVHQRVRYIGRALVLGEPFLLVACLTTSATGH